LHETSKEKKGQDNNLGWGVLEAVLIYGDVTEVKNQICVAVYIQITLYPPVAQALPAIAAIAASSLPCRHRAGLAIGAIKARKVL
jgi:hypothetical protein